MSGTSTLLKSTTPLLDRLRLILQPYAIHHTAPSLISRFLELPHYHQDGNEGSHCDLTTVVFFDQISCWMCTLISLRGTPS